MNKRRILFATVPFDGHFSPLTSLAVHLHEQGHDVRWLVGGKYGRKVTELGLHHYPYVNTQAINQENIDTFCPERIRLKNPIAKLRFDINQVFLLRVPEQVADVKAIYKQWPFDMLVHDIGFLGGAFLRELLPIKTACVGVLPLTETDPYVPPTGMGVKPQSGFFGRQLIRILQFAVNNVMFKPCNELYNSIRRDHGLQPISSFIFDTAVKQCDVYLQSGVPGFEFPRKNISPHVRYVGPMFPYKSSESKGFAHVDRALRYKRVVLTTQGTFERDIEKILVPTLEAFKDDPDTLVIATTGGSGTDVLRKRFPQSNIIIDDFIPFESVMPYANVYVTNSGYGGVMLALQHELPVVAAGIHEGKAEIASRIDFCHLGINLNTESPTPVQIRKAVHKIGNDHSYAQHLSKIRAEFSQYNSTGLATRYLSEILDDHVLTPQNTSHPAKELIA
ncbi:glycosyltransferase [Arsenicibacter rosenii]|uniref:Glycosyl transferase n=1 Tax=Arsenicibacter rosenii TaxID=1750698 RepID=A0A1S2VPS6_9BACT|nr:nucleotide disphospho-sugar-binding domain-containing protein [Arsenicibacter rosenii]OIN60754.1 glycosyl transferase [Arsenicibacter rosenii]